MTGQLIEVPIREITLCVGWENCGCNRCRIARLYVRNDDEGRELILQMYNTIKGNKE